MEPHRMSSQEAHFLAQNVNSLLEVGLPSQQPQYPALDTVSNSGPRLEDELMKELSGIYGDPVFQDTLIQDVWYDTSTLFLEDKSEDSGGARVLQAPASSGNTAGVDNISLEVDEEEALKGVMERAKLIEENFNTIGKPAYSRYGYPFKSFAEFYKACSENGFLKFNSSLDEPPFATLNESEVADLIRLERIDGFVDTKGMMKEME